MQKCRDSAVSNQRLYPTFARTIPSTSKVSKSIISLMKHFGWTRFQVKTEPRTILIYIVHSIRPDWTKTTVYRLMVPSVRRSTVGDRAFTIAGPRVWNTLPKEIYDVALADALYLRQRLKTWLFRKSYPDIIIWTFLIQTINLEVALLHRQFLIDWLIRSSITDSLYVSASDRLSTVGCRA